MKTNKIIVAILVVGLLIASAIFFGNKQEVVVEENEAYQTLQAEYKSNFIGGCIDGDTATYQECACSYDFAVETYGFDGFVEIALEYVKTDELPDELIDTLVDECF